MPPRFKLRDSYLQDAAHMLKLADVITRDGRVSPQKRAAIVNALNSISTQLTGLLGANHVENNSPDTRSTGTPSR